MQRAAAWLERPPLDKIVMDLEGTGSGIATIGTSADHHSRSSDIVSKARRVREDEL